MMKTKTLFLLTILIFQIQKFSAQETVIYDAYPTEQEAYGGGKKQMYKDFHNILTKNNYESCPNKDEEMYIKIIVKNNNKISLIKNPDTTYINKNKCTYNLIKKVLPEMNGWKAAEYKGQKLNAIYEFNIFLDDLFEDYKDGYIGISDKITLAEYSNGKSNGFRNAFIKIFEKPNEDYYGFLLFLVKFTVNIDGTIDNIQITSSQKMPEHEKNILIAINKLKNNWIPAKKRGIPVKSTYNFPITFNYR